MATTRSKKQKPAVFVGSTVEGLQLARVVEQQICHETEVTIWKDGIFGLSETSIESLEQSLSKFDFAVLILTPDDKVYSREKTSDAPRDNLLLELGLFIGHLGRKRVFIVIPDKPEIKLPSDLLGVKPTKYRTDRSDGNLAASVSPAASEVLTAIAREGLRDNTLADRLGVHDISSGRGRADAFRDIRSRAQQNIVIVGVAMHQLSKLALNSLEEQASRVPIEMLMMDPKALEEDKGLNELLSEFLRFEEVSSLVRNSYTALEKLCTRWNSTSPKHRMSLRVYRSLPTMSMVMVDASSDPSDGQGELVIEFFLYQCGEYRPRFHILNTGNPEDLFSGARSEYLRLRTASRTVVE